MSIISPSPTTDPLNYADHIALLRPHDPTLADELATFRGMEQVLQWMQTRNFPKESLDLICQDEFSYDFLLQLPPNGRWLSFAVS